MSTVCSALICSCSVERAQKEAASVPPKGSTTTTKLEGWSTCHRLTASTYSNAKSNDGEAVVVDVVVVVVTEDVDGSTTVGTPPTPPLPPMFPFGGFGAVGVVIVVVAAPALALTTPRDHPGK